MPKERKLSNWVESWEEYTDGSPAPSLWKKWSGISTIAAALERKVWVTTSIGTLYPNLYVILCGPPGTGKTASTAKVAAFLQTLNDGTDKGIHIASSSITFASMVDELEEAKRDIVRLDLEPNRYQFNALTIVANELGVLLPEYDLYMMPKLTDLYDNHPYSERRRTSGKYLKIEAPMLNFLAACTPSYLNTTLPQGAWDQGFLSRTLIAFSSENTIREIWGIFDAKTELETQLRDDLALIFDANETFGPMAFEKEAATHLEQWHKKGGQPAPDHPKLMHYNTRRTTQVLKLCMIASLAESSDRIIRLTHLQTALEWLLELEISLPDIFKAMVAGGDGQAISETWYYFAAEYAKDGKPILERRVVEFLMQRIPAHSVVRCLDVMVRSGMFQETLGNGVGKVYTPRARKKV